MRVDNSSFLELTKKSNTAEARGNVSVSIDHTKETKGSSSGNFTVSLQESIYGKPDATVAEEIALTPDGEQDAMSRHNEIAVLSNSMSPEDYEKMRENGFSVEDADSHTIVTVVEKIKMELAASGVDVSAMGDAPDLEELEKYTGSRALAVQMAKSMDSADVPVTAENLLEEQKAHALAKALEPLSDGAVKYMLDNHLEPEIINLYRAENAAGTDYGTAELDEKEKEDLSGQVEDLLAQAGELLNEENLNNSYWMIANQIPLTAENLDYVRELKNLTLPLEDGEIISAMTTAVAEGERPENAMMLRGHSLTDQAAEALEAVENATDEDLKYLIENDLELTAGNLKQAEKVRENKSAAVAEDGKKTGDTAASGTGSIRGAETDAASKTGTAGAGNTEFEIAMVTARRQLEETRLVMTAQANYSLLKQGISVDTRPLEQLVDELKGIEDTYYKTLLADAGAAESPENTSLLKETLGKVNELSYMPAYALGIKEADTDTIEGLHREGAALKAAMDKAGESYETMKTEVRKDLGDSIQKAFRNVDEILDDLSLPKTAANERAVRILGYNSLEITEESVLEMKAADEQVQRTFKNLTPSVVANLIKEQINPLDMDFEELNRQAEAIKQDTGTAEEDKFSEYLWKLEQNQEISPEERESYIGIYRLLNQVEKSDGAAIGALLNQGLELTMRNLLTEVRSEKKSGMDYTVDDEFDGVENASGSISITDQIEAGFQTEKVKDVMDILSPENLKLVLEETSWEDATPEEFYDALAEADTESETEAYAKSQLEQLGAAEKAEEAVYQMLEEYEVPNSISNILAAKELLTDRNQLYKRLFALGDTAYADEEEVDFDAVKQDILEKFAEAVKTPEEMAAAQQNLAEVAENVMKTMLASTDAVTSLDIRDLKLLNSQIALGTAAAKKESYNIPILVQGETGTMSLKIVHGEKNKGIVDIMFSLSALGSAAAKLRAENGSVSGYIACDNQETLALLQEHEGEFADEIREATGAENTDIRYVYSNTLDLDQFASSSRAQSSGMAGVPGAGSQQMPGMTGTSVAEDMQQDADMESTHTDTGDLYRIAKSFLNMLNRI